MDDYTQDRFARVMSPSGRTLALRVFRAHGMLSSEPERGDGSLHLQNLAECYEILERARRDKESVSDSS